MDHLTVLANSHLPKSMNPYKEICMSSVRSCIAFAIFVSSFIAQYANADDDENFSDRLIGLVSTELDLKRYSVTVDCEISASIISRAKRDAGACPLISRCALAHGFRPML
jgi:hypothetical protein